jgi:hypothetical protein
VNSTTCLDDDEDEDEDDANINDTPKVFGTGRNEPYT